VSQKARPTAAVLPQATDQCCLRLKQSSGLQTSVNLRLAGCCAFIELGLVEHRPLEDGLAHPTDTSRTNVVHGLEVVREFAGRTGAGWKRQGSTPRTSVEVHLRTSRDRAATCGWMGCNGSSRVQRNDMSPRLFVGAAAAVTRWG
jgi:hypothetical protein